MLVGVGSIGVNVDVVVIDFDEVIVVVTCFYFA